MALELELAGSQIDGARDYQEDAFLITHLNDGKGNPAALIIIADGMGGHAAGNVASNMAVQAFNKHVSTNYPTDNPAEILHECVIKANNSIKETVKETPALSGMGCTMVAAILETGKVWWASVGDSHLYLIRNKERKKINADHSYGGFLDRMAAAGTPVEPEPGLARNMLMSAVTGDEISEVDISQEPLELKDGDRIMLCSDGMDTLSEGKFIQFTDWSESPKECVDALLKAVEEAAMPKQDNTTIVVVDVKEKTVAAEPAPPPQVAESVPQPEPAPVQTPAWQPQLEPEKKSRTGLIAGLAVLLIGIGAGAWFMLGTPQSPVPMLTSGDAVEQRTEPLPGPAIEPEPETAVAEETINEEPVTEPAIAASEAPRGTPAATTAGNEFHDVLQDGSPGPTMVRLPGASYEMGSPGSSGNAEERPRHSVRLGGYAIGKYEITFAQYEKFARATGREIPDNLYMEKETHPVIFITWDDALYYTRWLSEQTGENYSIPSESQWEYAAGAGVRSPFWWGFEEEPNRAHCFGCGSGFDPRKPTRIGSFAANPLGVYDTAGNVAEWVRDCWHDNYNGAPNTGEVWEGGECSTRIVRGGSYSSPPSSIRHARRDRFKSDGRYDNIGFRVVRQIN